jgi:hypothetical protein
MWGSPQTYKKRLLPVTAHSHQLKANAMTLEIVRVMVMNLSVSRAPQRRSRYRRQAGRSKKVNRSWKSMARSEVNNRGIWFISSKYSDIMGQTNLEEMGLYKAGGY